MAALYENFNACIGFDGDVATKRRRWTLSVSYKTVSTKEVIGKFFGRLYEIYQIPLKEMHGSGASKEIPGAASGGQQQTKEAAQTMFHLELSCKLELPDGVYLTAICFNRRLENVSRDPDGQGSVFLTIRLQPEKSTLNFKFAVF